MWPVKKASAITVCTAARTASADIITSWRGNRSAHTPPITTKTTREPQ